MSVDAIFKGTTGGTYDVASDTDGSGKAVQHMSWRPAASATTVDVSSSDTSLEVVAANPDRQGLLLTNTDANDCVLFYGATAVFAGPYTVPMPSGAYWEMPYRYTGQITAIWEAAGSGGLVGSEL